LKGLNRFSRISFLKPVTMAMATIITAKPIATPVTAILTIGFDMVAELNLEEEIFLAINNS